jgi:hypothetical protein
MALAGALLAKFIQPVQSKKTVSKVLRKMFSAGESFTLLFNALLSLFLIDSPETKSIAPIPSIKSLKI